MLFSHIPLSRPSHTSCGPLREKGTIHHGAGLGYQNTLSDEASRFLLQNVRPFIIFRYVPFHSLVVDFLELFWLTGILHSGDDHDYCSITHSFPPRQDDPSRRHAQADEISVKSFSMAMGIKRTGFQLLSLVSPSPDQVQLHKPCQLPNQLQIYLWGYLPLLVLSILCLIILNVRRIRGSRAGPKISRSKTSAVHAAVVEDEEEEANIGFTSGLFGRWEKLEVEDNMNGRRLSASGPVFVSLSSSTSEDEEWGGNSDYASYHESVDENGNLDETAGPVHFLPAPVSPCRSKPSTNHIHQERQPSQRGLFSWTFVLGNQRRRFFIPPISGIPRVLIERAKGWTSRRQRRDGEKERMRIGFVKGLVNDVLSVAWPPLGLFFMIAWWMFR